MDVRKMLSLLVLFALVLTGCSQLQSESTSHPTVTPTSVSTPTQTSTPNLTVTPLETYLIDFGEVNVTACTQKANQFGRCIDEGKSPEECIRSINASWKSEVNISGYPLLQLQYKR